MFESLKKLLGGKISLKNPQGLSGDFIKRLTADLAPLKEFGLLGKALQFVVDGEEEGVLLEVRGRREIEEAMVMMTGRSNTSAFKTKLRDHPRRALFAKLEVGNGEVLYRLGVLYHAIVVGLPSHTLCVSDLPDDQHWLEALIREGSGSMADVTPFFAEDVTWSAQDFETILKASGHSADVLARHVTARVPGRYSAEENFFATIRGLNDYLGENGAAVAELFAEANAAGKVELVNRVERYDVPIRGELLAALCQVAAGPAKLAREKAQALLRTDQADRAEVVAEARRLVAAGKTGERKLAIVWSVQLEGESVLEYLKARLEVEQVRGVVAEIEQVLQTGVAMEEAAEAPPLEVPAAREFGVTVEVTPEMEEDIVRTTETFSAEAAEEHQRIYASSKRKISDAERREQTSLPADRLKKMVPLLRSGVGLLDLKPPKRALAYWFAATILDRRFRDFAERHHLGLVGRIRLLTILGFIRIEPQHQHPLWQERLEDVALEWMADYMEGPGRDLTLRDLGAAFEAAGLPSSLLVAPYTIHRWDQAWNPLRLAPDRIWPYFADRIEALEESLGIRPMAGISDWEIPENRKLAYRVLETFPAPPPTLLPFLWEQTLGGGKTERPLAWASLKNVPGRRERLEAALGDGKKLVRAAAAEWLGEMGSEEAVGPLVQALKKEKMDDVKAAIMEALEKCGAELDRFLNRSKLQEEAEKGLAKGIPKALAWFPFDGLPEVRWEKNRRRVPNEVLRWMIVQACKAKNAEPGPLLRRYAVLMDPKGRKALGMFVLQSWLSEDTKPANTPDEAAAYAERDTTQMTSHAAAHPEWYPDFNADAYRKQVYRHFLEECMGSANSSKGILAVAAAGGDTEMVPLASAYVKKWYGRRMHQCKALLRMLSWVDHGTAIQYVLSVSTRFRTKGIQKEAGLVADEIAARKGWTRDEMADRTIPDGGFGEDGTQQIDYGSRQFVARLMDDFSIELKRADGKAIKSLPNATKAEDEAEVKELKKGFTSAKREIKAVVKLQKDRLYEAMCQGRSWRFEDWDLFLNRHTVVGRYCQRLVWMAERDGEVLTCFRPLPDRTLTDAEDEVVDLHPDDRVRLAHRADLEEAVVAVWIEHLRDYEVEPLFPQLDTKLRTLAEDAGKLDEIKKFEGYLISSFRLRGEASKRGYTRGEAEDAGWFYTYNKRFEGLGLQATIEFTGNGIPEEDRTVALQRMYFTRQSSEPGQRGNARHVLLKDLPPVLLSECWNDLEAVAAKGEGFDKDWEKKSEY